MVNGKLVLGVGNPDATIASSVNVNDGAWHHVAATRNNASGAMAVYVDGTLSGSGTGPTGARTAPPTLRIGSLQTGNNFLNGVIDEVRLYDRILTPGDIAALANPVVAPNAPTGLTAAPGDGQNSLAWSASTGATSYRIKQSTADGGPYSVIATNAGLAFLDTGLSNGTVYYYVVSAQNSGGESPDSTQAFARPVSLAPVPLDSTAVDGVLQLAWPSDHIGWRLQVQTNAPGDGLGTNWLVLSGTSLTNQFSLPVDPDNGSVFLRLISP